MLFPIRCFTCGKLIGDKYEEYVKLIAEGYTPKEALDELGIRRYCCRRHFLTDVEIAREMTVYSLGRRGEHERTGED